MTTGNVFNAIGLIVAAGGLIMWFYGNFSFAGLAVAAPVLFAAFILFGLAQVIETLERTANATEAILREIKSQSRTKPQP